MRETPSASQAHSGIGGRGEAYPSTRQAFYKRFFSEPIRRYWREGDRRRGRKPPDRNWFDFGAGKTEVKFGWSFHRGDRFSAEIYIDTGNREINLAYLDLLRDVPGLGKSMKERLCWEPLRKRRACRITIYYPAEVKRLMEKPEAVEDLLQWAVRRMEALERAFGEPIRNL